MAKLRAITGGKSKEKTFSLVYGVRLYPPAQVSRVSHGAALLRDGTTSPVPLRVLRGSRAQIRAQVLASLDALFGRGQQEAKKTPVPARAVSEETNEAGC